MLYGSVRSHLLNKCGILLCWGFVGKRYPTRMAVYSLWLIIFTANGSVKIPCEGVWSMRSMGRLMARSGCSRVQKAVPKPMGPGCNFQGPGADACRTSIKRVCCWGGLAHCDGRFFEWEGFEFLLRRTNCFFVAALGSPT